MELKPARAPTFSGSGTVIFSAWFALPERSYPGIVVRYLMRKTLRSVRFKASAIGPVRGNFLTWPAGDDLWRLLATLTVRKAALMIRHLTRQKRGGGRVLGEAAVQLGDPAAEDNRGLVGIASPEPPPDAAACFADVFEHLIKKLNNATLKVIAIRKLEGYSVQEISAELGTSTRTIDRKLKLIRALWEEGVG